MSEIKDSLLPRNLISLFLLLLTTSCTSGGMVKRSNSAQPVIDSSGAKIYSIDPKTGATLSASGVATDDHNFSQAAVIIPSGTLSFPVSVSMYQAETLITSDTQSAVGVGDLTATGPAVAVVPSQSVAVSGSLAISIPYNQPQSLTGSWKLVVIAVYQVDGKTVIETFPESQLDFKSTPGVVKLNVKYFGAFQVAYSQVEIPKIEKVEAPVVVVQKQITKPVTSSTPKPAQSPKVARPRVDVPPGSYKEVQVISLLSSTEGATIYYTTNGQIPTADSTKYSDPIKIENSKTMIIRAIALKNGFDPSDLFFGRYQVSLPKAAVPKIKKLEKALGDGSAGQFSTLISLVSDTPGAKIYCKIKDTPSSPIDRSHMEDCTGELIGVDIGTPIQAVTVAPGYQDSEMIDITPAYTHLFEGKWKRSCFPVSEGQFAFTPGSGVNYLSEEFSFKVGQVDDAWAGNMTRTVYGFKDSDCRDVLTQDVPRIVEKSFSITARPISHEFKLDVDSTSWLVEFDRNMMTMKPCADAFCSAQTLGMPQYFTRNEPNVPQFWIKGPSEQNIELGVSYILQSSANFPVSFGLEPASQDFCDQFDASQVFTCRAGSYADDSFEITILENPGVPNSRILAKKFVKVLRPTISIEVTDSDKNAAPRQYTQALLAKGEISVGDCYNINLKIENSVNDFSRGYFTADSVDAMLQHGLLYDGADCKLENRYTNQFAALSADDGSAIDQSRTFSFKPLKFIHGDGLVLEARIVSTITVVVPTAQKKLKIPEYPLNYELISLSGDPANGVSSLQLAFDSAYAKYREDNKKTYIISFSGFGPDVGIIDVTKTGWPKNIRLYGDQAADPNANSIMNIFSDGTPCESSSGTLVDTPNKYDGKDIFIVGNGHVKVESISANADECDYQPTDEYVSYNAGHISLFNMKVESQVTAVGRNGGHGGNVFLSSVLGGKVDTSSYGLNVTPTFGGNAGNVTAVDGGADIIEAFGGAGSSKGGDGGVINIIHDMPQVTTVFTVGGDGPIVGKGGSCKINGNSCDGWRTETVDGKTVMVRGNLMWSGLVVSGQGYKEHVFNDAAFECYDLAPSGAWRLPTLDELRDARRNGITHYAKAGWINDMNKPFWSYSSPDTEAEIFNLNTGISSRKSLSSSEEFPAICVRDHEWTRTQFGSTTIIKDKRENRLWYESNGKLTLNDAKASCARGLISQSWRLPTLHELQEARENGIIFELTKDPALDYVFWSEGLISGSYSNVDVANWAVDSSLDLNIARRTLCVQSSSEVQ